MEVVCYGKVRRESLWMGFMALNGGAQCSNLLELIGHMILVRKASMECFWIHQRLIPHAECVIRRNVEMMAQRAGKHGARRS